jgi:uncharacterized protein
MNRKKEIIVWRFVDGKIGHEKQSLALVNFLKLEMNIKSFDIFTTSLFFTVFNKLKSLKNLPSADLIIGVGHNVHLSILIAKAIFGGKSILIMKPSFPIHWFDLCIIPEHDRYFGRGSVYRTKGALCDIKKIGKKNPRKGLILIGGASRSFIWDSNSVIKQIKKLVIKNPQIKFELSTSRRTPIDFLDKLGRLKEELNKNLKLSNTKKQKNNWVMDKMHEAKYAWITEDSISMISESLTSGQLVGILTLENTKGNRRREALDILKKEGWIFYNQDESYQNKNKLKIFPNEAKKCANWIKHNLYQFKKTKKDG